MTFATLWLLIIVATGEAPQGWYFDTEKDCKAVAAWMNDSPVIEREYGCVAIHHSPFMLGEKP